MPCVALNGGIHPEKMNGRERRALASRSPDVEGENGGNEKSEVRVEKANQMPDGIVAQIVKAPAGHDEHSAGRQKRAAGTAVPALLPSHGNMLLK